MPEVSIIVPVYNVAEYLPDCLDSIINQTYKKLEIILVDDGSKDISGKICDDYAEKDIRIKVIHQENLGVACARLKAFEVSSGEYIMFVDADDFIDSKIVELMLNALLNNNVDLTCCQYWEYTCATKRKCETLLRPKAGFYEKGKIIKLLKANFLYDKKTKMAAMNPFLWCKLLKRRYVKNALIQGIGLNYGEDHVGALQIFYEINSMFVMPEYLYFYRMRDGQITKTYNANLWQSIAKYLLKIKENDISGFLTKQIPYRSFAMLVMLINMELEQNDKSERVCSNIRMYTEMLPETLNLKLKKLGIKDLAKYYLVRFNLLNTYKMLLKIKTRFFS